MPDNAEQFHRLSAALADRYRIDRELGRGGMATVYLAEDLKNKRQVAIKVLKPEIASVVGPDRFIREIAVTAKLDHPHILALHDSGEAAGFLYYVMPYVEGETLRDRLNREKQLPIDEAIRIAGEVADALHFAHQQDVMHRDVKPENILLGAGHARVADFGIARAISSSDGDRITETGLAVGTPAYMSPEQAAGESDLDARSDVYALGCVLFEMLGGDPPYRASTPNAVLALKVAGPVPTVRVLRETVSPALDLILRKALAKSPADRFATAQEFARALLTPELSSADVPVAQLEGAGQRGQRFGHIAAVVVAALVIASVILLWPGSFRGGPSATISPTRIAVFPFRVQGSSELDYLHEGLMDLLSDALDGAGALRRVDPYALTGTLRREAATSLDPQRGDEIAARFGAGHYVLGSAVDLGDGLRLSASLYRLGGEGDPIARSVADGQREALGELTEKLATDLIAHLPVGEGARLSGRGIARAADYVALKAYLEGEALWRRGWPDSALVPLRRAVATDSTFALAWYRLSVAEGFGSWTRAAAAIDNAMRYRDRLSERDRLLVEIEHALYSGDGVRGEQLAQEVTRQYPDHVEGWSFLGRGRVFHSWQVGQPFSWAREPLERALTLEPDHPHAAWHAMWVAMLDRRYQDATSLLDRTMRGGGAPYYLAGTPHFLAYLQGDTSAFARLTTELIPLGPDVVLGRAKMLVQFSDSMEAGVRLARLAFEEGGPQADQALAHMRLAHFELARGRWEQAKAEFAAAARWAPALALVYRAWHATMPFLEVPEPELRRLRDSLEVWAVPARIPGVGTFGIPDELGPHVKPYLLGLVNARLGASEAVARHATALEEAVSPTDPNGLRRDLALEFRALALAEAGRINDALSTVEEMGLGVSSRHDQFETLNRRPLGRYLRAELLFAAGRNDEAFGWHGGWVSSFTPEYVWLAPAHRTMGEIRERAGQFDEAIEHYTSFIARWRDADPRLQPRVEEVRQRLARLVRERS